MLTHRCHIDGIALANTGCSAGGDKPQAIINRHKFLNHYATPFFKELHGRKSCLSHANAAPRLIVLTVAVAR